MRTALLVSAFLAVVPSCALALTAEEEARVVAALASGSFKVRIQATITLGEKGSPAAAGPLARMLSDPETAVRGAAAVALGRLGAPAGIDALAIAAEDTDEFVRAHIRQALLAFARPERFERLWAAARTAGTHGRRALADAIARIPSDPARIALLPLSADPDPGVREIATQALVALPPGERAALLARGLQNGIGRVRARAATLIARLRVTDLIPALAATAARADEIDEVRRVAKRALWELRHDVDPGPAREVLASGASVEERARAAVLLGVCGGDHALATLAAALGDGNPRLRWVVAQALADRGSSDAAAAIRSAAGREVDFGTRIRLERLARDAGQPPAWQSIALGNP